MVDFFLSIDIAFFFFLNKSVANPLFDLLMPFLTDLNKNRPMLTILGAGIVYFLWKGGATGRKTIALILLSVLVGDQFNSVVLKDIFGRIRPCRALEGVRMLVDCGGGLSFPSSHAVNNFAGAAVISQFYKKQKWFWYGFASLVALSRPYVGVHYPSDIIAGGIVGFIIGYSFVQLWLFMENKIKKPLLINKTN